MKVALTALISVAAFSIGSASDVIWETRWNWSTPPATQGGKAGFSEGPEGIREVSATADGGALIEERYYHSWYSQELSGINRWSVLTRLAPSGQTIYALELFGYDFQCSADVSLYKIDGSWDENLYYGFFFDGLKKYSPTGQLEWTRNDHRYGHNQPSLAVLPDGRSYLTYQISENFFEYEQIRLEAFDPQGGTLWTYDFPQEQNFNTLRVYDVRVDIDGNILVRASGATTELISFSPSGQLLGSVTLPIALNGTGQYDFNRFEFAANGNVLSWTYGVNRLDCFARSGSLLWSVPTLNSILNVETDDRYVYLLIQNSSKVLVYDHAGNLVREITVQTTPNGGSALPVLAYLGNFQYGMEGTQRRLTVPLGVAEEFSALASAAGITSDRFDVAYDATGVTVRRIRAGIDHASATLVRGVTSEHSRYALLSSSDGYWGVRPGPTLSTSQAPVSIELTHIAPLDDPIEMSVIVESRTTASAVKQWVEVYNFTTSTWTPLESGVSLPTGTSPDRYVALNIANPAQHISGSREIKVRVQYRAVGPVLSFPWTARLDREMVRYVK